MHRGCHELWCQMPLIALAFALFIVVLAVALTPLALVQRYRFGTARRRARRWVLALNVGGLLLSSLVFFAGAAVMSMWVPRAVLYSAGGFATGLLLGRLGIALTRFEPARGALHYTPNRWLVLLITLGVSARVLFGFWRSWVTWRGAPDLAAWAAASGMAGSLGIGAVVLGYYLAYWIGVRRVMARTFQRYPA